MRLASELTELAFSPREALAGKDARSLARDSVHMTQEEFSAALEGPSMKRAKSRALTRNAAVMLVNVGTVRDADVLSCALDDEEPLARAHAAWAPERLRRRRAGPLDQGTRGQSGLGVV